MSHPAASSDLALCYRARQRAACDELRRLQAPHTDQKEISGVIRILRRATPTLARGSEGQLGSPFLLPTLKPLGIDPIEFGVVVVCMVEIGLMTPAVGLNVYVLKGAGRNVSIADIRDCGRFGWFVFVDTINAALLLAVAQISLFAPQSTIKEGPLCRAQPARPA